MTTKKEQKILLKEKPEMIEPIQKDGEFYWLLRSYKDAPCPIDNTPVEELAKDHTPIKQIAVYTLEDQGKWQCLRCGCVSTFLPHDGKPMECYESDGGCGRVSQFRVFTPKINPDLWKIPKWEDIPVEKLDMLTAYNNTVILIKRTLVFVEEVMYKILALWIISTYKKNSWYTVGFPFFVGLPESGKSKGLDVIYELGWRMIPSANCKFTAMVRASHVYGAGVLIDEVEYKLSAKTERGQEMLEFIKPGYRKGVKYCVADLQDPMGIISYNNFSFRALAGENIYDIAMKSRCIPFEMEKDLPEIEDIRKIQDDLDKTQTTLFNYKYKTDDPPELPEDFVLHGRIRELFESIVRTGMHIKVDVKDVIEFAQRHEQEQISEFQNSVEREVLQHIYNFQMSTTLDNYTDDAPEEIAISEISEKLGWEDAKEKQRLGYILRGKSMRLRTFHTRYGKVLRFSDPKTQRKLTYLYKRYGVVPDE